MMTQTATCVAPQPVDDVKLAQQLEAQSSALTAQAKDETAGINTAEPPLPMEEEESTLVPDSCARLPIAPETLSKFRRGYGEDAVQVAQQLKQIVVTSAEGILRQAKLLLKMKEQLNRKEWGIWLREVLGWFGNEATPYLQIAKAFKNFDPAAFCELEPFTILKLRTKRYATVVGRLREEVAITSQLIQNFIQEVIPKQSRKKKAAPNYDDSVLKQCLNGEDNTFYFTLHANLGDKQGSWLESKLKYRTVGQVLEQAAAWEQQDESRRHDRREGLEAEVEQRVRNRVEMAGFALKREIAELKTQLQTRTNPSELVGQTTSLTAHQSPEQKEVIALRAQHKLGSVQPSEDRATYPEEQQMVVVDDARSCNATAYGGSLPPQNSSQEEELSSSDRAGAEFEEKPALAVAAFEDKVAIMSDEVGEALEAQVADLAPELTAEYRVEASEPTDLSEPAPEEASAKPTEVVEETRSNAIPQAVELSEAVQETACLESSVDASAADHQPITPPWEQLKQLRDAEGYLHEIDTQIQDLNSKLATPRLDRIVERELKDVLRNRQNLRSTKICQIVSLADSNGIRADYEQLQSEGRIILAPDYASEVLKQAKSWSDVALVSSSDYTQLKNAVFKWTLAEKQLLVQLLSEYLENEPNAFDQIDWIPEKLLKKVLLTLSFTLEKIRKTDNLVDEPEVEQICGCKFKSVANLGNPQEQWFFQTGDKVLDVFGRSGFAVEKF